MNLDNCVGCHSQPAVGGTGGAVNPQFAFATKNGAKNAVPPFVTANGPPLGARFLKKADGSADGGAKVLFNVSGRADAPSACNLAQPDFAKEFAANNVVLRTSTPLFGAGLIDQIPNQAILANIGRDAQRKAQLGIKGKTNNFGRFGWKSQVAALQFFTAAGYNAEMGVSSDQFPLEAADTAACQEAPTPNLVADFGKATVAEGLSDYDKAAAFMRFLAPPTPSNDTPGGAASITKGKGLFTSVGCDLCHTPQLQTGNASVAALRNKAVNLFSDLLVYNMGTGLADNITQGAAGGQDWRATPLWGLGQRIFLLHDGRTKDLRQAILAHQSTGSEANAVIDQYNALSDAEEQDLLNFLRSL